MNIATLRDKVERWLPPQHAWPWSPPPLPQILPPYTTRLFKLAHIALGDVDSAATLVADVLLRAPASEEAALRRLIALMPRGWLSWPTAAGPADELRLSLKRERADRLLSLLGQADPAARIGLALHLLDDVPRDELQSWLGVAGIEQRVERMIVHIGGSLELLPPPGDQPACVRLAPELLDAHDPQIGRLIRRHTVGCEACRVRAEGIAHTIDLLRRALDTFFRAPPPDDIARRMAQRQHLVRKRVVNPWIAAPLVVLLLVLVGRAVGAASDTAAAPQVLTSSAIIDRALQRWDRHTIRYGVLRERVTIGMDDETRVLERWYDYSPPHRMRITLYKPDDPTPLLDLTTDGSRRLAYRVVRGSAIEQGYVENEQVAQWMPLLQQLPTVGSVGRLPVSNYQSDALLLAQAQRDGAVLLGATQWSYRPAWLLMSTSTSGERVQLTIDRETYALLEARINTSMSGTTTTASRRVWRTDLLEMLNRPDVPGNIFRVARAKPAQTLLNPRQIGGRTELLLNLDTAVVNNPLPVPTVLPEPSVLAYLRLPSRLSTSVSQVYEGPWSTLIIESSLLPMPRLVRPPRGEFAGGRFERIPATRDQATILEWTLNTAPQERKRLYLWHALLSDAERDQLALRILDSMTAVDSANADQFRARFVQPDAQGGRLNRPRFMLNGDPGLLRHRSKEPKRRSRNVD